MNMKFALAAGVCAAALAGFSDVTSANVVGYMGKETPASGNKMIAGMFNEVSADAAFKLSDIKGTGYDKEEGAWGELSIVVLGPGGIADTFTSDDVTLNPAAEKYLGEKKIFYWFDNEEISAGWYMDGNGDVAWDDSAVTFSAGTAFWSIGYGQSIMIAGQVNNNDVLVGTPASGNKGTGNPYPTTIKLADIYGDGYDKEEGAWGELSFAVLGVGGTADVFGDADVALNPALEKYRGSKKLFYWFDNEEITAGWYMDGNGDVAWDAEAVIFPAGEGFWAIGYGQSIVFPAPKLNN